VVNISIVVVYNVAPFDLIMILLLATFIRSNTLFPSSG